MKDTPKRFAAERGASIRPSSFDEADGQVLNGAYDDRHGFVLSADTRNVIEFQGARTRTTLWGLERGLGRWENLPEIDRMHRARRALIAAGSEEANGSRWAWKLTTRDGKRSVFRHVSKRTRRRIGDLALDLGLSAEAMAGWAVTAGLFDVLTVPLPTNLRLARDLAGAIADLRDRVRRAERLINPSAAARATLTTWGDLTGAKSRHVGTGVRA